MTKQAASRLVDEIVRKGYAERRPHPEDARARLVVLTERGRARTRAAQEAAAEVVERRGDLLGGGERRLMRERMARIAPVAPSGPPGDDVPARRRAAAHLAAGHRRNFLPTRNFTHPLPARNLTNEQHPVIRITG